MILTNEFDVKARVEDVWQLLDQIDAVVPCMPGAAYLSRDGDNHHAAIRLKLGAINTHFQGIVRIEEQDEVTHTIKIRGNGKDSGGKGSATATVSATLEPRSNANTHVIVKTDLAITGKIAQFGGGVLADISSRLIAQFAQNLQGMIESRQSISPLSAENSAHSPAAATAPETPVSATVPHETPAIDLGRIALPVALSIARRYIVVPVAFFVLGWLAGRYL